MIKAKKFIYYSTIFMLFGSNLYFNHQNALQLFYLLMIINFFLMLLMKRLWIPKGLLAFAAFLFCSGALGVLRETDTVLSATKEFSGILISAFYFCSFFRLIDFELDIAFRMYARMAYWIVLVGFVYFPIDYLLNHATRMRSILQEPAMIAFTCLPALYFFADQWQRKRIYKKELVVLSIGMLLAQSSTGFIGLMIGTFIFCLRYRRSIALIPGILIVLGVGLYSLSDEFALRFNDTYNTFATADVSNTNLSTYVLYTNFFVMKQVLEEHPLVGNGLGSHGESYKRFIGELPANSWNGTDVENWNSEDASSLGTRVLSDMGLSGACLLLWFIWKYRPTGTSDNDAICRGLWIYFAIKILRGGQYFENEQYFFVCLYAISPVRDKLLGIPAYARSRVLRLESQYS